MLEGLTHNKAQGAYRKLLGTRETLTCLACDDLNKYMYKFLIISKELTLFVVLTSDGKGAGGADGPTGTGINALVSNVDIGHYCIHV